MGRFSKVEWCDHTHNFWIGCEKVSEACKSCYAEVETYPRVQRARGRELWGKGAARHITGDANWRKLHTWNKDAAAAGRTDRVFVNSMSDFFEAREDLIDVRRRAWALMRQYTNLTFLLLTKRPENIAEMLPPDWGDGYPNVWIGCTVENQQRAEERLRHLLAIRAVVLFVSCEPLLAPIDLTAVRWADGDVKISMNALTGEAIVEDSQSPSAYTNEADGNGRLSWVIIGGESGRAPRVFNIQDARRLIDQCRAAGVAPFMKQLGAEPWEIGWHGDAVPIDALTDRRKGGDPSEWPKDLRVREFPMPAAAA